jgi:hypothetical protein
VAAHSSGRFAQTIHDRHPQPFFGYAFRDQQVETGLIEASQFLEQRCSRFPQIACRTQYFDMRISGASV